MTKEIITCGVCVPANVTTTVETDDYVPLTFRAKILVDAVEHYMLGQGGRSLLELKVDSSSRALFGLTLTLFDEEHVPSLIQVPVRDAGLPQIATSDSYSGIAEFKRVETNIPLSVGYGDDFVEITFGDIGSADRVISCDRMEFYISSGTLVGVRAVSLSSAEVANVRSLRS